MKQIKSLKEITNNNYMLKLGAIWCSPCKMEDTILNNDNIINLSEKKKINIYKIDIDDDEFESFIDSQNISSIPVILYYKNNELIKKAINFQTEQQILDDINKIY